MNIAASLDKNGAIVVKFNRTSGMGPTNKLEEPVYQFALSTSPDGEKTTLNTYVTNEGNPIGLNIALPELSADVIKDMGKNVVQPPFLKENVIYYVWVRAVYPTYGTSEWSKTLASKAIPSIPSAIEYAKVETGDKRLVVSWKAKDGERYGVGIDSGSGCQQPF